jgi:hypothetical protein
VPYVKQLDVNPDKFKLSIIGAIMKIGTIDGQKTGASSGYYFALKHNPKEKRIYCDKIEIDSIDISLGDPDLSGIPGGVHQIYLSDDIYPQILCYQKDIRKWKPGAIKWLLRNGPFLDPLVQTRLHELTGSDKKHTEISQGQSHAALINEYTALKFYKRTL